MEPRRRRDVDGDHADGAGGHGGGGSESSTDGVCGGRCDLRQQRWRGDLEEFVASAAECADRNRSGGQSGTCLCWGDAGTEYRHHQVERRREADAVLDVPGRKLLGLRHGDCGRPAGECLRHWVYLWDGFSRYGGGGAIEIGSDLYGIPREDIGRWKQGGVFDLSRWSVWGRGVWRGGGRERKCRGRFRARDDCGTDGVRRLPGYERRVGGELAERGDRLCGASERTGERVDAGVVCGRASVDHGPCYRMRCRTLPLVLGW